MNTEHPKDVVRLATARNPFGAHAWEQALKEEDIYCKVVGDYLDSGIGDISGVLPEIWVREEDIDRARDVLHRLEQLQARSREQPEISEGGAE
jgi:hypothetical protein